MDFSTLVALWSVLFTSFTVYLRVEYAKIPQQAINPQDRNLFYVFYILSNWTFTLAMLSILNFDLLSQKNNFDERFPLILLVLLSSFVSFKLLKFICSRVPDLERNPKQFVFWIFVAVNFCTNLIVFLVSLGLFLILLGSHIEKLDCFTGWIMEKLDYFTGWIKYYPLSSIPLFILYTLLYQPARTVAESLEKKQQAKLGRLERSGVQDPGTGREGEGGSGEGSESRDTTGG